MAWCGVIIYNVMEYTDVCEHYARWLIYIMDCRDKETVIRQVDQIMELTYSILPHPPIERWYSW